jgi:GTP-binding protein
MKILSAEFVRSAKKPGDYPPAGITEIAFAGRSNVGKSSLINALLNRKRIARTSTTPGRTREINFYRINDRFAFVDLPGYGYAKVPESVRRQWGPMVETYLRDRRTLKLVVVILDSRRDPSDEDRQLIKWLEFYSILFFIVITKTDKISRNALTIRKRMIGDLLDLSAGRILIPFSAKSGQGKERVWREIEKSFYLDTKNQV